MSSSVGRRRRIGLAFLDPDGHWSCQPDDAGASRSGARGIWILTACVALIGVQHAVEADIAFQSDRDGELHIYLMEDDGSDVRRVREESEWEELPAWSPDGERLCYYAEELPPQRGLYILDVDRGSPPAFTGMPAWESAWSPDGRAIVGVSPHPDDPSACTLRVLDMSTLIWDGVPRDVAVWCSRPAWSPDALRIVVGQRVLDADTYELVDTLFKGRPVTTPQWSPDGSRLAFASRGLGLEWADWEIYVMNADGTGMRQLTSDPAWDGWPTWSPNGRSIAFSSLRDGNYEIYAVSADGGPVRRLTDHAADDKHPAWRPDPSVFVRFVGSLSLTWAWVKQWEGSGE